MNICLSNDLGVEVYQHAVDCQVFPPVHAADAQPHPNLVDDEELIKVITASANNILPDEA